MAVISSISCVSAMEHDSNASVIVSDTAPEEIHVSPDASDETGDGSLEYAVSNGKNDSTIHLNDGKYVGEKNRNITIDK